MSKAIALSTIAILCCFAMMIVGHGWDFNWFHFGIASAMSTLMFSFLGFVAVANVDTINRFILKVVVAVVIIALPFLGYFGLVSEYWFVLIPSAPAIALFDLAFDPNPSIIDYIWAYGGTGLWTAIMYKWCLNRMSKSFTE